MRRQLYLPLFAVCLFCLALAGGCPNKEAAGQFTVVKGTVLNRRTGRPLPGVRVAIVSAPSSRLYYDEVVDSVLADARGQYALSFTNESGLFYAVNCGGLDDYANLRPLYLDFPDSVIYGTNGSTGTYPSLATVALTLGRNNVANFRASPRRVWQVQVTTLTTRYQKLYFTAPLHYASYPGPADNQRRTVLLYQSIPFTTAAPQNFYQTPGTPPTAHFGRGVNSTYQDTTVQLMPITPLTGDTVRATLKFGR